MSEVREVRELEELLAEAQVDGARFALRRDHRAGAGSGSRRSGLSAGPPTPCSASRWATASPGIGALSVTVPIAAATAAVVGVPQAAGDLRLEVLAAAAGLALLLPVLPYALEVLALRRMTCR